MTHSAVSACTQGQAQTAMEFFIIFLITVIFPEISWNVCVVMFRVKRHEHTRAVGFYGNGNEQLAFMETGMWRTASRPSHCCPGSHHQRKPWASATSKSYPLATDTGGGGGGFRRGEIRRENFAVQKNGEITPPEIFVLWDPEFFLLCVPPWGGGLAQGLGTLGGGSEF